MNNFEQMCATFEALGIPYENSCTSYNTIWCPIQFAHASSGQPLLIMDRNGISIFTKDKNTDDKVAMAFNKHTYHSILTTALEWYYANYDQNS